MRFIKADDGVRRLRVYVLLKMRPKTNLLAGALPSRILGLAG
jgi:hypothetical protein